jgi:hypothetical protein
LYILFCFSLSLSTQSHVTWFYFVLSEAQNVRYVGKAGRVYEAFSMRQVVPEGLSYLSVTWKVFLLKKNL